MRTLILLLGLNAASFALSPGEEAKVKDIARDYIKDHVKALSTAVFSRESVCAPLGKADAAEANGTGPTPECKPQLADKVGDGAEHVVYRSSVDSPNSYGAIIRTKFQLGVYFTKEKWLVIDAANIARELKTSCIELRKAGGRRDCNAEFPSVK